MNMRRRQAGACLAVMNMRTLRRMSRFFGAASLLAVLSLASPAFAAEDKTTLKEIRDLRALIETQSKQIEELTKQVSKLSETLANAPEPAAPAAAPSIQTPTAPTAPATAEFSTDIPKAEPADGKRHVVVKGETLTSIAKSYNISLSELQKANKGVDERKLQIGAVVVIPTPKTPEAAPANPTEKKENP